MSYLSSCSGTSPKRPQEWGTLRRTVFSAWLSASITRSWKLHLGVRIKPPVISCFPEKTLRTPGTGTGKAAIHHFYTLFLLFLLNWTANKELDNLVPGLIRPKLSIPPRFLLCGKMLVSLLQSFLTFSCVESLLFMLWYRKIQFFGNLAFFDFPH